MVEVVLATLIDDAHQIILGRSRIGKNAVDLAEDERSLIVAVVNAKSKWLCLYVYYSSK
jgi:hypothetical protein